MKNKMFKRCIVGMLALCMMFSQTNIIRATDSNGAQTTVTEASLIASNYELSDAEKTVINDSSINSLKVTYNTPTASDVAVSIDADALVVKATNYDDNGLTWVATSFSVVENGSVTQKDLPMTNASGVSTGTFARPSSQNYSIDVTYTLKVSVDAKTQKRILNTPYYFLKGYEGVEAAYDVTAEMVYAGTCVAFYAMLQEAFEEAGREFLPNEPETVAAIENLTERLAYDESLDIYFFYEFDELAADYENYNPKRTGKELQFAFNGQGYKFLTELKGINTHLQTILNSAAEGELYELEEKLINTGDEVGSIMTDVYYELDNAATKIAKAVNAEALSAVTANADEALLADYANVKALKETVTDSGAKVSKKDSVTINTNLYVTETVIRANMNTNDLTVKLVATVLNNKNVEETKTLTDVVTLNNGTDKATVEAAVKEMTTALLLQWADAYQVNDVNYTVTYPTYGALTEDVTYTITYVPNNYAVKVTRGEKVDNYTFAYGYNYTLPNAEEEGRTYSYSINGSAYNYKQGDVYRIVGNTTIVAQNEKEVTSKRVLDVLVADTDYAISAGEKAILESTAIKSDKVQYAIPANADKLVSVEPNGLGGYTLTALTLAANANMTWVPVAYHINSKTAEAKPITSSTYTETFTASNVSVVYVDYELVVKEYVGGKVTASYLKEQLNIPYTVVTDAKEDTQILNAFYNKYGSKFNRSELGTAITLAPTLLADEPASLEAANNLIEHAMNGKKLILAEILEEFIGTGSVRNITSFYKNYDEFAYQVDLLFENLKALTNSKVLQQELGDYLPMFFELIEALEELKADVASMKPSKYIDLNASTLANLNALLTTKDVKKYTTANVLTDRATVAGEVAGMVYVTVTTNAKVNGTLTGEVSESIAYAYNHVLTDNDVKNIENTLKGLDRSFDTVHYESKGYTLPKAGDQLVSNIDVVDTWVPKTYTVNIVEGSEVISTHEVTYENATVELPAHPVAGYRYDYYDANNTLLGATYTVTADVFDTVFATGSTTITRVEVNVAATQLKDTIDAFDAALGNMKSGFALMENNGKYAVVFQLDMSELADAKNIIMNWAMSLAGAPYAYIGMGDNNHPFWANAQLSVQAVINSVLESDLSMQALMDVIEDGKLSNTKMNQLLEGYTVAGANHPSVYGGLVIDSFLYFGADASDALEVPFYITLTDVTGTNADQLNKVDSYLAKAQPYVNVDTEEDRLNVTADASVYRIYEVVLAGMLVTGYADLDDVTDVEVKALFDFIKSQYETITAEEVTYETFANTLTKLGVGTTLPKETINKVLNVLRTINENVTLGDVTESGNSLISSLTANLQPVLGSLGLTDALMNLIAENKDGKVELSVPMSFTLENFDKGYQAFIFDNSKSGLNKIKFTNTLAADLASAGSNAVVVLLSDYTGDVTVKNGIIMDLNGKTISGTMTNTSSSAVKVFNSDLNNDGGITKVSGAFAITGGSYSTDVTDMLPSGYVQTSGLVAHELYTVSEDVSGNITLTLNADKLTSVTEADLTYFAIDAALKAGLNFYTASSATVDGNTLYDFNIQDVVGLLADASKTDLVNEAIDIVDVVGVSKFASQLIADVTDFGAIATALESGDALVSYELVTKPWGVEVAVADGNYITANLNGNEEVAVKRMIKVKVAGKEDLLVDVFNHLDNILVVAPFEGHDFVEIADISYNGGLTVDGTLANFDVTVDFTKDVRYTTIMAVILGYSNQATMKDAVTAYVVDGDKDALVAAVDKLTVADVVKAVKGAYNVTFSKMVSTLGLTGQVNDAKELEADYHAYLNVMYAVANRLSVTGPSTKLASWKDGETYTISRENWHRTNLKLTVKLFADPVVAEPVVTVRANLSKENVFGFESFTDEETNVNYIVLDTVAEGITSSMFSNGNTPIYFETQDCEYVTHTFTSGVVVSEVTGAERVATGANLVVTVKDNSGKEIEITYVVVVLGDVNCNGLVESSDVYHMRRHNLELESILDIKAIDNNVAALMAADINGNDQIESVDALNARMKNLFNYEYNDTKTLKYKSYLVQQ